MKITMTRRSTRGLMVLAFAALSGCVGVGYGGGGYGVGFYEPGGYDYGGWGHGYRVGRQLLQMQVRN